MVKVRQDRPLQEDGSLDVRGWVALLGDRVELVRPERVVAAAQCALRAEQEAIAARNIWASGISSFETGLEMADILADLRLDEDSIVAAILYRAVRENKLDLAVVREDFGATVSDLVEGVLRMAAVSALKLSSSTKVLSNDAEQIENVRRMLVALVDDVRVALIKLAERTCAIRSVKVARPERRERVAREVFDVYAPLAHRLGIGQLRWELEDLSFRYLQTDAYMRIASLLSERREARQHYIDDVVGTLREQLRAASIRAEVYGRPKHIYSIWRKMQQKGIGFDQVYDVRAVRVLVDELRDCYAALGIVHALWRHIPHEFDDYIANPKENGYRSIHTAVIGPEGRTLEVQIRTHEMHEEAELGVCAHWVYKGSETSGDAGYEEKVAWLRQVLEWQEELGSLADIGDTLRRDFSQERIYVLTPDGHVIDMTPGSTPLDFAYRIHTEIGHHCRGARVDGRIVPLNYPLRTGEKVEIITAEDAEPSPQWLNPNLAYVNTSRARAKLRSFFSARDRDRNVAEGRALVVRDLRRFAIPRDALPALVAILQMEDEEALFLAVGSGEFDLARLQQAAETLYSERGDDAQMALLPGAGEEPAARASVRGVGNLRWQLASCCCPGPDDAISGYVTPGEGVAIHRHDCPEMLRMSRADGSRVLQVYWGESAAPSVLHALHVSAYDRAGLLRDISEVFASERIDMVSASTRSDRATNTAIVEVQVELPSLTDLGRIMDRIGEIPNVIEVHRSAPA